MPDNFIVRIKLESSESNKINRNSEKNKISQSYLFDNNKMFKLIFELNEMNLENKNYENEFILPLKNIQSNFYQQLIFIFSKNTPLHTINGENKYFTVFIINYNKESNNNELAKSIIVRIIKF